MTGAKKIKAVLVTNVPVPYRLPTLQLVANEADIELSIIYCARSHIESALNEPSLGLNSYFLKGRYVAMEKRFMHADFGILQLLEKLKPDVVITTGFIPTFLFAFAWTAVRGKRHVAMTDGTAKSESVLSSAHRLIRRFVFKRTVAFIGASYGSLELFHHYGLDEERMHLARLCVQNERFNQTRVDKVVDFLFCGRFVRHKRPIFAMQVAYLAAQLLGRKVRIDFLGQGVMESEMKVYARSVEDLVEVRMLGYLPQEELPLRYASARIFLFPTEWEPWGLVANEACAAGLPVIVSPNAGVAGELILDGVNGYVLDLDISTWANAAVNLLTDETRYADFSRNARDRVAIYSFLIAADGMATAIRQAAKLKTFADAHLISELVSVTTDKRLNRKVCIIQAVSKQYRLPFFDRLYQRLREVGVDLEVIYSEPNIDEARRKDSVDLPSAYGAKVHARWYLDGRLLYQPAMRQALKADLVIMEHASKHLVNYLLFICSFFFGPNVAFWGHGRNWQRTHFSLSEKIKRFFICRADWWFAYTRGVANYLAESGFDPERITIVQNSVEIESFRNEVAAIGSVEYESLRIELGIANTDRVGLFCGSMHEGKKLEFLIQSAHEIHSRLPTFQLLLVGAGPRQSSAISAAEADWIHYVGPQFGMSRAKFFAISDVFLCPGMVGLAVLDAFAAGLPVITTDAPGHSPEIEYLVDGVSGLITKADSAAYADAVENILRDENMLNTFKANAAASSNEFGIDQMVENFTQGVIACLNRS